MKVSWQFADATRHYARQFSAGSGHQYAKIQ